MARACTLPSVAEKKKPVMPGFIDDLLDQSPIERLARNDRFVGQVEVLREAFGMPPPWESDSVLEDEEDDFVW